MRDRAAALWRCSAPQGAVLSLIPPGKRGLPAQEDFARRARSVIVEVAPAEAVARFNDGYIDVLLGGRIDSSAAGRRRRTGPRRRADDPVSGLFGLMVENAQGYLGEAANREALAMAIDRDALLGAFNVSGWSGTTRIVAPETPGDLGTIGERWAGMGIEQRRAAAAERVARWKAAGNPPPVLRIAIGRGPVRRSFSTGCARTSPPSAFRCSGWAKPRRPTCA
jgi:peptide/nickel transport system substrate-binding protein/oligopeptide transport system substrate-binding protein